MFLTLTLPSYGKITPTAHRWTQIAMTTVGAALDALHFPKLVDRFWQNLRRCAGYKVQYFAAVEPQHRLAPHLHAAVRGAIPRATVRQVVSATYVRSGGPSSTGRSTSTGFRCGMAAATAIPTPARFCRPGMRRSRRGRILGRRM
ncbi:MAG TPA: replication initiator [Propionibacteriaceae bacterium]|nr:replication initiator [Propionibacteriaceae bacterium]